MLINNTFVFWIRVSTFHGTATLQNDIVVAQVAHQCGLRGVCVCERKRMCICLCLIVSLSLSTFVTMSVCRGYPIS